MAQREYSEETARRIDAEIEQLLKAAHGRVRETLVAKRAILEALAKRLIEKEVVDRGALARLIAETETPAMSGGAAPRAGESAGEGGIGCRENEGVERRCVRASS